MLLYFLEPHLVATLGGISAALFLLTLAGLPWAVAYLPEDYFIRPRRTRIEISAKEWIWLITKNVVGGVMLVAGVAMLLLPGQGLLTILVAVMLMDFPGKRRLEFLLVRRPRVLASLNWLRRRMGRPPLLVERPDRSD